MFVYQKEDISSLKHNRLHIAHVIFIDSVRTADYRLTRMLRDILKNEAAVEDIDAVLEDKNIPLDSESRLQLAERILREPPLQGYLTISNALQWRLQYGRAISVAKTLTVMGVENLLLASE